VRHRQPEKGPSKPTKTAADRLEQLVLDAAAKAVVAYLKPRLAASPGRLLAKLTKEEVAGIATAAISGWIKRRSELATLMAANGVDWTLSFENPAKAGKPFDDALDDLFAAEDALKALD
jgi:hypothetical protein